MPAFTYPMVFILNEETGLYNGYIPDLTLYCDGETLEAVYAAARELINYYFDLATKYNTEIPTPSTLDETSRKWTGYKVSLITAVTK
jgi:predicted RNase H-like HicB family nuclease